MTISKLDNLIHMNNLRFYLSYCNTTDWHLIIQTRAKKEIFEGQSCDLKLLMAKAEVALKEWLSENRGGY